MPFVSQAQARFAFATNQPWAKKWADKTDFSKLPRKVRAKVRNYRRMVSKKEVPSAVPSVGNAMGPGGLFSAPALEKGRIKKKSGFEGHTSAMIALYLPAEAATDLQEQGRSIFGQSGEKADDLHITLAYLGEVGEIEDKIPYLMAAVQGYAANYCSLFQKPISAIIGGIGAFETLQDDGTYPVYFGVDSPDIVQFVRGLGTILDIVGLSPDRTAGNGEFHPHVTIAYRPSDQIPSCQVTDRTVLFDTLTVALGDIHIDLPLSPPIASFKAVADGSAPAAPRTPVGIPKPSSKPASGGGGTPGEQIAPGVTRIRGNLCQVHGKFGPCDSATSEGFDKKPKKAKGGKGKGGKGGKAPKTAADRKAERDQRRAESEQAKQQQTAQNRQNALGSLSSRPNDGAMAALDSLRKGGTAPEGVLAGLEKEGLVDKHSDGTYTLSASGHKLQNSLDKGDAGGAQEAIAGAHDAVKHRQDVAAAGAQRQMDQALRKREIADRQAKRAADMKKRDEERQKRLADRQKKGSGSKKPKSPKVDTTDTEEQLKNLQENFARLLKLHPDIKLPPLPSRPASSPVGDKRPVTGPGKRRTKEMADAPGYEPAASPGTSCAACENFQLHTCVMYDFRPDPTYTCESWHSRNLAVALASSYVPNPSQIGLKALDDDSGFMAFKQSDGRWRWILYSSDAFEDRDGEVVTRKALEADVARTDKDGNYGPLRWWHVGSPKWQNPLDWRSVVPGPGLDIGTTDFSAMSGPVLIESGLFNSPEIGAAISRKAADLQSSLGFSHPLNEPDADGLYHHIKRFERSLTPKLKASNPRTHAIMIKEAPQVQDEKKLAAFKALVGEDVAETALQQAAATTKEAREAGIREKGQEPEPEPDSLEAIQAQIQALSSQMESYKAKKDEVVTNAKADGAPPAQEPSTISAKAADHQEPDGDEGGMEEGDDDGDEDMYIGDMTAPEFVAVLQQGLAPLFEGVSKSIDLHNKVNDVHKAMGEMKQYLGGLGQKDSERAEQAELFKTLQQQVITLKEALDSAQQELQDLQGSMPRVASRPQGAAYKASEATDNVLNPNQAGYQTPIGAEQGSQVQMSPLGWLDTFVINQQQGTPGQAGVQPAVVIPQQ